MCIAAVCCVCGPAFSFFLSYSLSSAQADIPRALCSAAAHGGWEKAWHGVLCHPHTAPFPCPLPAELGLLLLPTTPASSVLLSPHSHSLWIVCIWLGLPSTSLWWRAARVGAFIGQGMVNRIGVKHSEQDMRHGEEED